MSKYRHQLPQLNGSLFLTDGGLETTLVFHEEIDLPYFAAFDLLKDDSGTETLRRCLASYAEIARDNGVGIIIESPTWRASQDWGDRMGYDAEALADANRRAIGLLLELRDTYETPTSPLVISGNLGPRGDGYLAVEKMTAEEARDYHRAQIHTFAETDADMLAALTMTYTEEAIGIVLAARDADMPVAISFTLETDGRLPSGEHLADAISATDEATEHYAAYFMINCAHPSHFEHVLQGEGDWRRRIRGLRANASRLSHAELDERTELDVGNSAELGSEYRALHSLLPELSVLGGCCGTDHRHVAAIYAACR